MALATHGVLTPFQHTCTWSVCPHSCVWLAALTPGQGWARVYGSGLSSGPWVLLRISAQGSFLNKGGPNKGGASRKTAKVVEFPPKPPHLVSTVINVLHYIVHLLQLMNQL